MKSTTVPAMLLASVLFATACSATGLWGSDALTTWLCNGRHKRHCVDLTDPAVTFTDLQSASLGRLQEYIADAVRDPSKAPTWLPDTLRSALAVAHHSLPLGLRGGSASDDAVLRHLVGLRKLLAPASEANSAQYHYPYFGFLPKVLTSVIPSVAGSTESFATECFAKVSVTAAWAVVNQSTRITITSEGQKSLFCEDNLILAAYGLGPAFLTVSAEGTTHHSIDASAAGLTTAMRWFASTKGIRVLRLNKSFLGAAIDVIETVTLMTGFKQSPLTNATFAANVDFMKHYIEISPRMQPLSRPRTAGSRVVDTLDESYINSGDGIAIVRYDGLDPLIAWGEGFTGGHSVIAIREPVNNTLYVCEATTNGAYWPRNGVQCTKWRQWFRQAKSAQQNVLLAPLSPELSAKFNSTAAWAFFKENEGFNYGYLNFVFPWIDVVKKNFPCLPPSFGYCLTDELLEFLMLLMDGVGNTPTNVFRQAMNHRLPGGFRGPPLPVGDAIMTAAVKHGLSFSDLYVAPELDSWRYNTTRYGKPAVGRAMVCCVFVCNMWLQGGVFSSIGNDLQCGEQTLWDIFSMQIFDTKKLGPNRPQVCIDADPDNEQCQLVGEATFHAKPDFNTRPLYPNMGNRCGSPTPNYNREPGC